PGGTTQLVWECVAGHSFSWGVPGSAGNCTPATGHHGEEQQGEDSGCSFQPGAGRQRSLRRGGLVAQSGSGKGEAELEGAAGSPVGGGEEPGAGSDDGDEGNAGELLCVPFSTLEKAERGAEPQEEEEDEEDEDFAEDDDLTYTDDLRDENYHPSLDSDSEPQRRQSQTKTRKKAVKEEQPQNEPNPTSSSPSEEKSGRASKTPFFFCFCRSWPERSRPTAPERILPSRVLRTTGPATKRMPQNSPRKYPGSSLEVFLASFLGFFPLFFLSFFCPTDKRDYICEFCARSFRTSSNLIIHRRIHTGEKPLQCEICGFTCRQKASLNWHMKKHDADSFYQFSCDICGKKFEKKDNVTAHKSKSHPEVPGGPPPGEGGQRSTVPSPPPHFRGQPEAPGTLATEPPELSGFGDALVRGDEPEKIPPPAAASAE
ncbi:ZFP91 ligase, partial [Podilymbus podiceps]|nr:ZFP91 ligase [Podilymbus podiceps]